MRREPATHLPLLEELNNGRENRSKRSGKPRILRGDRWKGGRKGVQKGENKKCFGKRATETTESREGKEGIVVETQVHLRPRIDEAEKKGKAMASSKNPSSKPRER